MQSDNTLRRHAALVDTMAGTLGLDLEELAFRGEITPDEIGEAVLRCTGCSSPGACDHWLDAHAEIGAGKPPEYCRNADLFARLAPR